MKSIRFTPIVRTVLLPIAASLLLLLTPIFTAARASAATDSCTPSGTTYGTDTVTMANVASAGTYTIWTRMQIPDSADNAVLLKVGGNCYNVGGSSSMATGTWKWVDTYDGSSSNVVSASLAAGNNTLVYTGTFAGVEIDRILAIAQGDNCVPADGTDGSNCTQITLPSTPSGVTATANSSTSVTVNWNASTDSGGPGLGGYLVFRNGTQIKSVSSTTTSYTDTTVSAGTQYTYTVEAFDTSNNASAASSGASVTTPSGAQSPTISLNAFPANTKVSGSSYALNTTVTPTSGNSISQVQLSINGTVVKTDTSSPYNFTFSTLGYHDGPYPVTVTATDNHGNTGQATTTMIVTNGDLNGDNKVNIADLSILAGNWQKTGVSYAQGDINGDGTVNVSDLSLLAGNWGASW